jgi:hypothetical protein
MVKDPEGKYHLCDGYIDKNGEPIFISPTKCGISWEHKKGWYVTYFLDVEEYKQDLCEECFNGN